MNKHKKITLFFLLFSLFNTKVYASCTTEEKNVFKKVESKYNITYEFDKTSKDYTITLYNPKYKLFSYSIDYEATNFSYYTILFYPSTSSQLPPSPSSCS